MRRSRACLCRGWEYIGKWSGPKLGDFLEAIDADQDAAKYVSFQCADDYYGIIDMASALHPQTQLATDYADAPIGVLIGAPAAPSGPTKLGFKSPKWITSIEVTNEYPGGYWEDRITTGSVEYETEDRGFVSLRAAPIGGTPLLSREGERFA